MQRLDIVPECAQLIARIPPSSSLVYSWMRAAMYRASSSTPATSADFRLDSQGSPMM
jgi:hypothetical protein